MIKSYIKVARNNSFRNLWFGQVASQIALNMLSFVLVIRVYQETHSNTAVSLMLLSFGIPSLIFGVIAGGLVDFYDKRAVLFYCNLIRVFLLFAFFLFYKNIYILFILTIFISIITQFFIPAEAPSIPHLVDKDELLTANSLFTISFYLSTIIGFVSAGPVIQMFGNRDVYMLMLILMAAATFFVYHMPAIRVLKKNSEKIDLDFIGRTIRDGLVFIRENARIRQSLILMTFSQALIATLAVLAPGFADQVLKINLTAASYLVLGPAAVGLVIGAFLVGGFGQKYLKGSIILAGILGTAVTLIFLSVITKAAAPSISIYIFFIRSHILFTNLTVAIVLLFILGLFNSFINVPANTILQGDTHHSMRGRVYGVLTSMTGGVSFLPVVFSGVLADIVGVGKTLFIIGIIILIAGIYHYFDRRSQYTIL
ncbi:MFS transporter [Patescibacteria group bacterium]|nr:MFS transporter [Patescibacteria group bacterium]MCL5797531.1 MFS transporter [Patescibacteria group bacterium]